MSTGSKVVIVGAGAVGTATANSILSKAICSEIVLIDINKDKASGEIMDMQHSIVFHSRNVKLVAGDYSDCKDADIVILTVAAPFDGVFNRLLLRDKTANILKSVVPSVTESGFDGIFLVVSNPVDSMTWLVQELSGFPTNRVIGTGTILETARFKFTLGNIMNVDPHSVDAYIMGEHGDSMVVPWSHIRIGGKAFLDIINDNKEKFKDLFLEDIEIATKQAGNDVMKAKGNTMFGIANAVTSIVQSILRNECKTHPVSVYLDGEYGLDGVYCGAPAIIGSKGIVDVGVFNLTKDELEKFLNSANVIKENFNGITK